MLTDAGRLLAQELKIGFRTIENACVAVTRQRGALRLKAPSTLTMRWLLGALNAFQLAHPQNRVQLTSARMDLDAVDFHSEPFDCAILLGNGGFPADWRRVKLFDEWLVPVCAPELLGAAPRSTEQLAAAELIHPSRDCRDWRRWLQRTGRVDEVAWQQGKLFDTLELGISAAAGAMACRSAIWPGRRRTAARQPWRCRCVRRCAPATAITRCGQAAASRRRLRACATTCSNTCRM